MRLLLWLCLGGIISLTLYSCQDDETGGIPEITGIRITDPNFADSTFTVGELGDKIVILGRNLAGTHTIMFNDVEAFLNPNYITNSNIILDIPLEVPTELNNQITLMTNSGTASYEFTVAIPGPVITKAKSEFLPAGDILVLEGDYFFSPEVIFGGGVEGVVVSETQRKIEVSVPEGVQPGRITVKTLFGESETPFVFNVQEGMLMDFNDKGKCWGGIAVVDAGTNPLPNPVNGNYAMAEFQDIGPGSWWNDAWVFAYCGDLGASGQVDRNFLKFEVNVLEEWDYGQYEIQLGDFFYQYKPYETAGEAFKTDGWITVSIPLSQFRRKSDSGVIDGAFMSSTDGLSNFVFNFQNPGPDAMPVLHMCFDNIRIVRQ